jgi:hypothetical protein
MQGRRLKVWRCSCAAEDIVVRRVGRATTLPWPGHILSYCFECYQLCSEITHKDKSKGSMILIKNMEWLYSGISPSKVTQIGWSVL